MITKIQLRPQTADDGKLIFADLGFLELFRLVGEERYDRVRIKTDSTHYGLLPSSKGNVYFEIGYNEVKADSIVIRRRGELDDVHDVDETTGL